MKLCLLNETQEDTVEVIDLVLSEKCKRQGDDDGHNGTLTCGDDLTYVDRDLDIRRSRSDDGAIGAA